MPPLQLKQEPGTGDKEITAKEEEEVKEESQPEVDIVINNVVCSFSVRCHLNLKEIALNGSNVEYRKENGMVTMKLRSAVTASAGYPQFTVCPFQASLHHRLHLELRQDHLHGRQQRGPGEGERQEVLPNITEVGRKI